MHRTKFLAVVIAFLMALQAEAQKKSEVFSEFNTEITSLKSALAKEKSPEVRMTLIEKSVSYLKGLRAKNPRQSEEQELNMSLYLDTLNYLPAKKDFKFKQCDKYQKDINNMMKQYTDPTKEVYVEEAFAVVRLLCKK